jgi:hypothetical protein
MKGHRSVSFPGAAMQRSCKLAGNGAITGGTSGAWRPFALHDHTRLTRRLPNSASNQDDLPLPIFSQRGAAPRDQ